ncbi:hypothetical protein WNY37_07560 [Henriciella sp. AS95]|uniref:hypothetical protein n=1 Tax=Henriciella sp. AS95 TaxID=3135782 RepID=UPI0031725217
MGTAILTLFALYLLGLGIAALARPEKARVFFSHFASSPRLNFIEAGLRALVGLAFILAGPDTAAPTMSVWVGGFLLASAIIMAVAYRLHRLYAVWAVPFAMRFVRLMGAGAVLLSVWVVWFRWS